MTLHPMPARAEWLAQRQRFIGGSEVAALFEAQAPYQMSKFALWHVKAGKAPAPEIDNARVAWGQRLESAIAAGAEAEWGYIIKPGRYAVCDDVPGMGASLDFETPSDPVGEWQGWGVVEIKNVDWLVHRQGWSDGEPPPHILLQLQHQLACAGYGWGAVVALVGGNTLVQYRYAARPKLIAEIKRRVAEFWRSIEADEPPPVDGSDGASAVIKALYRETTDDAIDMSAANDWPAVCEAFLSAQQRRKQADQDYDLARNQLAMMLGPHTSGYGGGYSVRVAITPAKRWRLAEPGERIPGRVEMRRYVVREAKREA